MSSPEVVNVAQETQRRPGRPARLSRDGVLAAAMELADREGLETLTMRRLGEHLGVEAMSLYRHVDHKEALLDGLVDLVFVEIERAAPEGGWQAALRRTAGSMRAALRRHPWAIGLMESRVTPGPENLRHRDALLGVLFDAGFTAADATHAINLVDSFVYGHALQERALPFDTDAPVADASETFVPHIPADTYPNLAAAAVDLIESGFVYAAEFDFGLELILDGLTRRTGSGTMSR